MTHAIRVFKYTVRVFKYTVRVFKYAIRVFKYAIIKKFGFSGTRSLKSSGFQVRTRV